MADDKKTNYAGYVGYAEVNGKKIRCTDMSLDLDQKMMFLDHIYGLRDTLSTGDTSKSEAAEGTINIQKKFWRPGVKIITGNISFPLTDTNFSDIFDLAKYAKSFPTTLMYSCDVGFKCPKCYINSLNFSVTGGDIATCTIGITGKSSESSATKATYTETERLLTWDKIKVTIDGKNSPIQNFSFDIKNDIKPIYTCGGNISQSLFPYDIRVGIQEVTGSVSFYGDTSAVIPLSADTATKTITISYGGENSIQMKCVLLPLKRKGSVTPYITTYAIQGVGKVWE